MAVRIFATFVFEMKETFRYEIFAPVVTFRFCTLAVTMFADRTFVVRMFATLTLAMFMTFR